MRIIRGRKLQKWLLVIQLFLTLQQSESNETVGINLDTMTTNSLPENSTIASPTPITQDPLTFSPTPIQLGPSTPHPESFGRKGYRRYHANDTLIGWPIPCTYEEKLCFKHNLLYDPKSGICVPFNMSIGCGTRINREEFEHGSHHVVAVVRKCEDCPGPRMAFDGKCYPSKTARDVFCACDDYEMTSHFFGGAECRCWTPKAIAIPQPPEDGLCSIPDLRFPQARIKTITGDGLSAETPKKFNCSAEQLECFSKGKLFLAGHPACTPLLRSGPCPPHHIAALSATAAQDGRADATCVHERGGCPHDQHRLAHDRACHDQRNLRLVLTPYRNEFGEHVISDDDINIRLTLGPYIRLTTEGNECVVITGFSYTKFGADDFDIKETVLDDFEPNK